ncbi:hypothetical protein AVEN_218699-1 [Araneus ventricosus]|uniref:Uncharacterized protein n=1 Tax=Araneus ventricosus TaxID=182803 RepID=A0A4Y2B4K4_ARAVE|nr:hypothetical protein AVEN_218699-1 [Araneus ventricosus]
MKKKKEKVCACHTGKCMSARFVRRSCDVGGGRSLMAQLFFHPRENCSDEAKDPTENEPATAQRCDLLPWVKSFQETSGTIARSKYLAANIPSLPTEIVFLFIYPPDKIYPGYF